MQSLSRVFSVLMVLVFLVTSLGEAPATAVQLAAAQAPAAPLQADLTVYGDALAAGWEDWSWDSTVDLANPLPVLGGSASIAVTFNAPYAGFSVRTSPALQAADFTAVSFFVYPPDTDRSLTLMLQSSDDGGLSQGFDFNAPADMWSQIVVDLESLGSPSTLARINIGDNSGAAQPVFYLDQISLYGAGSGATDDIPAVIPGAPKPTLTVTPQKGYAGESLSASGQAPGGLAPGISIRLAWLFDGATFNAGEAQLNASGAFSTGLSVPLGAPEGPARLCAALTGLAQAAFTCVDYLIEPATPAEVTGQLDPGLVSPGKQATVQLLDIAGDVVYSAPVSSTGSFILKQVKPGFYRYAVVGGLSKPAAPGKIEVASKIGVGLNISAYLPGATVDPVSGLSCFPENNLATVSTLSAAITDKGLGGLAAVPGAAGGAVSQQDAAAFSDRFATAVLDAKFLKLFRDDFGTYISGVTLNNTFTAKLQTVGDSVVDEVVFHIQRPNGSLVPLTSNAAYTASYNVGQLPAGKSKLIAAAVVGGERQCPTVREISVVADPMKSPRMQPGAATTWNGGQKVYQFAGTLPHVPGLLPLAHPSNPVTLPYLGNIQSKLNAGLSLSGTVQLSGVIRLQAMSAGAEAIILGRTLYKGSRDLTPGKTTFYPGLDPTNLENISIKTGRRTLWADRYDQTVFNAVLFSFLGIVNVGMTVKIGMSGQVILDATIYPFQPGVDMTLLPQVGVELTVSVWVNILVLASAGADAIPSVHLGLPLRIKTSDSRLAWFDNPCFGVNVDVKVWVKVDYFFDTWRKSHTFNVLRTDTPSGCLFGAQQVAAELLRQAEINLMLAPPEPRVMASPDIAANPGGRALSVYVEDLTPNAENPTPAVMARFKEPGSNTWLPAVQLSSGQRAVNDPVAAFFGPDMSQAMVAWTQTEMTQAEETAATTLAEYLNRTEIYVNRWNGTAWLGPERLTNDLMGDGMPAIAGGPFGVALAWVHDTDGDSATQADMVISRRSWSATNTSWGPVETFKAAPSGMNAHVSLSQAHYGDSSVSALAWVYDADGNPETLDDRRIHMAVSGPPNYDWELFNPQPLPGRVGSVSVAVDPFNGQLVHLAFTTYNLTGDQAGAGAVSDDTTLWTGWVSLDTDPPTAEYQALLDERGLPVRGERPRLDAGNKDEVVLTFRRFGDLGTTGQLGQAAYSRILDDAGDTYTPPVYLTGGLNQHWQTATAVNPLNNRLELLAVQRPPLNPAALQALGGFDPGAAGLTAEILAHPQALSLAAEKVALLRSLSVDAAAPSQAAAVLTANAVDPLVALTFDEDGDLALDPVLKVSQPHAAPGSTVMITATVRNLGRSAASGVLHFYRGLPGSGVQEAEVALGYLDVGDTLEVSKPYLVYGGNEPVYVEISILDGGDAAGANNLAVANLGDLPAPEIASVRPSPVFDDGLEIAILPSQAQAVAGYRVLRSATPGGPYELAGETTGDLHYDLLLEIDQPYCYVLQAYDRSGITSPYSGEVCGVIAGAGPGTGTPNVYLPIVRR